ncbi:L-lactate permease [Klebsiella pneumoniae]|uniref:L-lactate permease n=1 Tax=Klebsiella pneumoniae TaxID=573 RepID=A0A377ZZA3_KLEPN|nr:L-lactate permease [Klebsiella pneumoniae]
MGIPILVAGQVTGIDSFAIGQMVGRQLPFLTIIVLFLDHGDYGRLARH